MRSRAEQDAWIQQAPDYYYVRRFLGQACWARADAATLEEARAAAKTLGPRAMIYAVREGRGCHVENVS